MGIKYFNRSTKYVSNIFISSLRASTRARGLGFFLGGGRGWGEKGKERELAAMSQKFECLRLLKIAENADCWRFNLVMTLSFFERVVI